MKWVTTKFFCLENKIKKHSQKMNFLLCHISQHFTNWLEFSNWKNTRYLEFDEISLLSIQIAFQCTFGIEKIDRGMRFLKGDYGHISTD